MTMETNTNPNVLPLGQKPEGDEFDTALKKLENTFHVLISRLNALEGSLKVLQETNKKLESKPKEEKVDKEIARAVVDDNEKLNDIFDEIDSASEVGQFTQDEVQEETVEEEDAVVDTAGRLLLTYQSLDSSDIKELIAAIKRAPKEITEPVRELWLSNNNAGDGGIQALVTALATGILPNLAMLRVDGNGMSDLGENMLRGLRMMREGIAVVHKQEQFRDVRLT